MGATWNRSIWAVSAAFALVGSAFADWQVQTLHPVWLSDSFGYAGSGSEQAGQVRIGTATHAGTWNSVPSSFVDIHPSAATDSAVLGVFGTQQVGFATINGFEHASLWAGTDSSWIDLSPLGSSQSRANTTNGVCQGGYAVFDGISRAVKWIGSAESFVDLHPASASASVVNSIDGGTQIGTAYINGKSHASLWAGSAASWTDLHEVGTYSYAYGGGGGRQVGWTNIDGYDHASIWSGTSETWIDLHPSTVFASRAFATNGELQVGTITPSIGTLTQAAVWYGTPESAQILPTPPGFTTTFARSIGGGQIITVIGSGFNAALNRNEALLWVLNPTISGRVILHDYLGNIENLVATFTVFVNDVPVQSVLEILGPNGEFAFDTTHLGNVKVSVRLPHWLVQKSGDLAVLPQGVSNVQFPLIAGDVQIDNEINIVDYAEFASAFGTNPGDPLWNLSADLNGDQEVNLADFAYIAQNFGQVGD